MAIAKRYREIYECDLESELSLAWGDGIVAYCKENGGNWWRIEKGIWKAKGILGIAPTGTPDAITQDTTHRFATDAEKTTWNSKADGAHTHDWSVIQNKPTVFTPGYITGSGGSITQLTSKATGVTLSKSSGAITLNNAALAAATIVSFTLTDTQIAATDVLVLNHISGGTPGSYTLNARCAAGSAIINVRNNTAGSLSEAIVLQFVVIKGVNT